MNDKNNESNNHKSDFSELIIHTNNYIIGNESEQQEDHISSDLTNIENISKNLKVIRTHWFEGLQFFLMNGQKGNSKYLKDMYCYKNASSLTIPDNEKDRLYGAHIKAQMPAESRKESKSNTYATDCYDTINDRIQGCGLYLDLSKCKQWQDATQENKSILQAIIPGNEISQYIHFEQENTDCTIENILNQPENQELIIHAMREFPNKPVAYIITRSDDCSDIDYKNTLERLIISSSVLFFSRWNALWNQKQLLSVERLRRFNSHEYAQIIFGMTGTKKRLEKIHDKLNTGARYPEYIKSKFIDYQNICEDILVLERNIRKHIEMLDIITNCQDTETLIGNSSPTDFFPYYEIIYRWAEIFSERMENSKKELVISYPLPNDYSRPGMYSDSRKIEIIIYNFLTNADKYGYPDTKIFLDAHLSDDRKYYLFKVKDYGYSLPKDTNEIFSEGYKGKEVDHIAGNGLGLYRAKLVADSFEAKIIITERKKIFDYDI
ncbi:MAG: ATP-binding protein, partial [Oscillospiraceae bacterium]|nr:ATP-binding protein [Oscillospiraceae bacterium]